MDEIEENGQFKMPVDDDIEETMIPSSVDELRLEKISTRVTIISIMIPVLIVIVLVIAYLDIKKRVVQTEDTGSMSVQNLSKDLESRFSSLSLRQARLEEQMASFKDRNEQNMARIEIKLKGLEEKDQTLTGTLVSKKALNSSITGLDNKLGNLAKGIEDAQEQLNSSAEQLNTEAEKLRAEIERQNAELVKLRAGIATIDPRLEEISEKMALAEEEKMSKEEMDLALSLEALRIKQALKTPIDELADKLSALEKQLKVLKARTAAPPSPSPAPVVKPQSTSQSPKPAPRASGAAIEEKPIIQ